MRHNYTRNRGLDLKLIIGIINARKEKFVIKRWEDSDYAVNVEIRKSTSSAEITFSSASSLMSSAE